MEPIAEVVSSAKRRPKDTRDSVNGNNQSHTNGVDAPQGDDLALILASLQTMRDGNFSVRLPVAWTGLKGKIADTFNDIIAANERMAFELKRVGQAVGKRDVPGSVRRFRSLAAHGARCKARSIRWSRTCFDQPTR